MTPNRVNRPIASSAQARPKLGPGQISGNLGTWKSGNLVSKKINKQQTSKSKSVSPKMSARSGLVGNKTSWPHLGPFQAICSMGRTNVKHLLVFAIFLGGPMGPIHLVWTNGPGWGAVAVISWFNSTESCFNVMSVTS